jgi:hypothetical protein
MDQEVHRIWMLVLELSDQIAQNYRVGAELRGQITTLQVSNCTEWPLNSLIILSIYIPFRNTPR